MPSTRTSLHFNPAFTILMLLVFLQASGQDTTLKSISPFPFGAAINTNLLKNNPAYRAVVTREFNSVTAENVMKMAPIHPAMNTYNWVDADTLVNFAVQHNKRIHGHTLLWHQSIPGWINSFTGDSAAWENLVKTHIQTVVARYRGRLASWDVVNEAFNDDGTLRNSIWLQRLGSDYIARCFQYAHEADSAALLFYNDYGHEYSTAKLNAISTLINSLKTRGVPVHGVGLQMHMNKNTNNNMIANAIGVMAQTGLKVHISELDISMNPENNQSLTFTPALSQLQADKYKFVARAYKSIPAAQQFGITTWNVSDADTWITGTYSRPDWPLPFDNAYQKKHAYQGIVEGLTTNWKYDAASGRSISGTYTDLGANGTAITTNFAGANMTNDDDNSSVQQIGFNFEFNGSIYQQFVLNTNGYIKLGPNAPTSAAIFYPTFNGSTNSIITAPDIDVLYPYNHDLTGTGNTEYRVFTSGQPGSRICTIQYKNVADKLSPVQYASMSFQVRLYESGGIIEYVYGPWTASTSTPTLITAAVGIKGLNVTNSVNLAKGSGTAWNAALSTATTYFFVNGDYSAAGPQFNTRNNVLPDVGRTLRFVPLSEAVLPVKLSLFHAVNNKTSVTLNWQSSHEVNSRNYEVQRSTNGVTFEHVGTVASKETNAVGHGIYSFTDAQVAGLTGAVYYRLKQNDLDGNSTLSHILAVQLDMAGTMLSVRAQNPFRNILNLQIASNTSGNVNLSIANQSGIIMVNKVVPVSRGTNLVSVSEVGTLPAGIYILQCRKGEQVSRLRLMKE